MKNQYFGDINDYKKYSLLRILTDLGKMDTVVCWVLTANDMCNDGRRTQYLNQPEIWEKRDPVVYRHLKEHVLEKGIRNVQVIQHTNLLPNCRFFDRPIHDDIRSREEYFKIFKRFAAGADLVFFDPDNGLGVKSVPRGKRKSSKYIYWNELEESFKLGHSILIYQHFPRKPREIFIRELVEQFQNMNGIKSVFSFSTYHVAFILIPQPRHEEEFHKRTFKISEIWGDLIKVKCHNLANPIV